MRKTRTASRNRRAVWLYLVFVLVLAVFVWLLANIWLTRDTLSCYAPDNTVAILHASPTKNSWPEIINDLGQIQVISERHLSLKDISRFVKGEIAIFVLKDGRQAVAIRSNDELFPIKYLDAYGIVVSKLGKNEYLLSDTILPVSGSKSTIFSIKKLLPWIIGTIRIKLDDTEFQGYLKRTAYGYSIDMPKIDLAPLEPTYFPHGTAAAISIPPQKMPNLGNVTEHIDELIEPIDLAKTSDILSKLEKNGGAVIIRLQEDGNIGTFMAINSAGDLDNIGILKTIASLKNPALRPFELPDGTEATEIYVDPSSVVLEELIYGGTSVSKTQTPDGPVMSAIHNENLLLASDEEIFNAWISPEEQTEQKTCVDKSLMFIQPDLLHQISTKDKQFMQAAPFLGFLTNFKVVSINSGRSHDTIRLCK